MEIKSKDCHVCTTCPHARIYYCAGRWRIDDLGEGQATPIEYCPHCGIRLELEAKVKVSRNTLEFCARTMHGIGKSIVDGNYYSAQCDSDTLARSIEKLLDD